MSTVAKKRRRKIRVAVVGAQPLLRHGLEASLSRKPELIVVPAGLENGPRFGGAGSTPDVVIVDAESSPHALRDIRKRFPLAKVVVFSSADWKDEAQQAAGGLVQGYLRRSASVEDVFRAIETVHAGGIYFSARALRTTAAERERKGDPLLTNRERQVLKLVAEGKTSRDIANRLRVSVRTVESHRSNIAHKLGIRTVAGLTRFAIESGLIETD